MRDSSIVRHAGLLEPAHTLCWLISLLTWTVGNGLFPLVAVQASRLGVSRIGIGVFLAAIFLALSCGALVSEHLLRRTGSYGPVLILSGLVLTIGLSCMGIAPSFPWFAAATMTTWLGFGVQIASIKVCSAQIVEDGKRGAAFGLLAITVGLGSLLGGLAVGWMDEQFGFCIMLEILAVVLLLGPLAARYLGRLVDLRLTEDTRRFSAGTLKPKNTRMPTTVMHLALLNGCVCSAGFAARIGTPLAMHATGFSSLPISGTIAVGGALSIPLAILLGVWSDRIGRTKLLVASYLALTVGIGLLSVAATATDFFISAALVSIYFYAGSGLSLSLATDLTGREEAIDGIPGYEATYWLSGTFGFLVTGYAYEYWGREATFGAIAYFAATASVIAALLFLHWGRTKGSKLL